MTTQRFLFIAILCFIWSCRTNPTKRIVKSLPDGSKEVYYVLKSDTSKMDSTYLKINIQGDTIEKVDYKDGKIDGQRILYYDNGQVKIVENYLEDQYNGPYQSFFENGSPKQLGSFKNGEFEGELKTYYEDPPNQLKESVYFKGGIENGPFRQYHKNGQLEAEGTYKDGLRDGSFKEFHPNGTIAAEGQYLDDIENGDIKVFDTTGTLTRIYVFKDKFPIKTIKVRD